MRVPRRGTILQIQLSESGLFCYSLVHSDVYLVFFNFLTKKPVERNSLFNPENIRGAVKIFKLSKKFHKCGWIDLDGSDNEIWNENTPVTYVIEPEEFQLRRNGEDVFRTENWSGRKDIPEFATRDEIRKNNYYPSIWMGSKIDEQTAIKGITENFRVLEVGEFDERREHHKPKNIRTNSSETHEKTSIFTVNYSVNLTNFPSLTTSNPETLAEIIDKLEDEINDIQNDDFSIEVAGAGQELDSELFWEVDFTQKNNLANIQPNANSIGQIISSKLGLRTKDIKISS